MLDEVANVITERHGDTPLNNTPHFRRWVYPNFYDRADLIDQQDQVQMLIQPQGKYAMIHGAVMGRGMDISIIDALGGTAKTGKTASGTAPLPEGQKIAHGGSGLTVQKLRQAKKILDRNEVDEMHPRFFICSAEEMDNLLGTTEVTSSDFNTVRALVHGEFDTFLGFKFIRSERLRKEPSDNSRKCYAYAMPAICFKVWMEPSVTADRRPDKRNAWQLYTSGSWGATRLEDEMVVEVETVNAS